MTTSEMLTQGFVFDEDGGGYSYDLKGKWHPEESLISTGNFFANKGSVVFIYANKYGAEFEREDFPQ